MSDRVEGPAGPAARDSSIGRRRALQLLGAGGLTGAAAAGWAAWSDGLAGAQVSPVPVAVPPGGIVRTIRGDLNPNAITGAALMHEHMGSGQPEPGLAANPTTDREWMARELTIAHEKAGLGLLVAASITMPGPENIEHLTYLSQRSNVHLVAAGAYYMRPA